MKKTLIALAALAATGAFAQSSVTLSGAVDAGIENVSGAASQLQTSRNGTTHFAMSGTEDLGGGLKAKFLVNTSFDSSFSNAAGAANSNAGTGAASMLGNNGMFVGLEGGFGSVILGRPLNTLYGFAQIANGTKGVSGFAATDSVSSAGVFTANAVQYASPSFGGFSVQLEWNASEVNDVKDGSAIGLKYANGPMTLTAVRNDQKATALAGDNSAKVTQLAASYDFGMAKLFLTSQRDEAKASGAQGSYVAGLTAPVGRGTVWLQLGNQESAAGNKTITGLGYKHAMSKRTTAYLNYGTRNDLAAAGAGTTGYGLGLTHTF